MIEEVLSPPPKLFFKRPADSRKKKRQVIVDLIGGNPAGLTVMTWPPHSTVQLLRLRDDKPDQQGAG